MARSSSKIVGLGLGLVLLAALGAGGTPSEELPPREPNEPLPPVDDGELDRLARIVCACADETTGELTPIVLRFCVSEAAYPAAAWPPIPQDPATVRDAWAAIVELVSEYFADPGAFRLSHCVTLGGIEEVLGPGDVAAEAQVDVSALCEPPQPQSVAVRVIVGQGGVFTAEGYAAAQDAWLPFMDGQGGLRTWPNVAEALEGGRQAVMAFAAALCVQPVTPPPEVGDPVDWELAPASRPGYPWEAALIHRGGDGKHFPTPGMFFLVRDPLAPTDGILALDSILGIARAALASAYAMAGAPRTLGDIPDNQVLAYVNLIACSPWNDAAYGSNDPGTVGGGLGLGPHGRGVNMFPRHRDNVGQLAQGDPAVRSTFLNGIEDQSIPGADRWPQLWLPPIRLDLLTQLGSVTTSGFQWTNGDSVIVPPPAVWNHGVQALVAPPGGWGC